MPDVGVLDDVTGAAQPAWAKRRKEPVMVDAVAGDPRVHDPTARVLCRGAAAVAQEIDGSVRLRRSPGVLHVRGKGTLEAVGDRVAKCHHSAATAGPAHLDRLHHYHVTERTNAPELRSQLPGAAGEIDVCRATACRVAPACAAGT
jgi:hypothetical protein